MGETSEWGRRQPTPGADSRDAEPSDSGGAGAKPRAVARGGQRGAGRCAEAVECNRLYHRGLKKAEKCGGDCPQLRIPRHKNTSF